MLLSVGGKHTHQLKRAKTPSPTGLSKHLLPLLPAKSRFLGPDQGKISCGVSGRKRLAPGSGVSP